MTRVFETHSIFETSSRKPLALGKAQTSLAFHSLMRSLTYWYKRNKVCFLFHVFGYLRGGESFAHFNSDLEFLTY